MSDGTWEVPGTVLPYAGTSGWSGSDTSRERAARDDGDGTIGRRQQQVVRLLGERRLAGATWRDVSDALGVHHGSASGALSVLHKEGRIARLLQRRDRCHVYVLPEFVDHRITEPHGGRRRDDSAAAILTDLIDELRDGYESDPYLGGWHLRAVAMLHAADRAEARLRGTEQ